MWKKLEVSILEDPPVFLDPTDICYYARDYVSHGGFQASEANNLISNLKKHPSLEQASPYQWRHKLNAVDQFAREISEALPDGTTVAAIPTSKRADDPDYDPRLDMVLSRLVEIRCTIIVEKPIRRIKSSQPKHHGGKRSIAEVCACLEWVGFSSSVPKHIVLIDDVVTCGTNFKACKRLIAENHPSLRVMGLFWARTIWPGGILP